ncbi:hypothetical protein BD770DRAFT_411986 [Pilaira anomala]|nr:hypothetical protein BD770DRAFT_411986 [Pilaira anomala]
MFKGRISLSTNDSIHNLELKDNIFISTKLEFPVSASTIPNLLQELESYQEINEKVLELLNYDFRLKAKLLGGIPSLFYGAIFHDSITLLVITFKLAQYRIKNIQNMVDNLYLRSNVDKCFVSHSSNANSDITTRDFRDDIKTLEKMKNVHGNKFIFWGT